MNKIYELSKLHLDPEDIILIKIDINEFDIEEAEQIFKNFKKVLPNTPMICIPKGVEITAKHKQDLINYLINEVD